MTESENKVTIDLNRYNELIVAETMLMLLKDTLFGGIDNRLSWDKEYVEFNIDAQTIKTLFPTQYASALATLKGEK